MMTDDSVVTSPEGSTPSDSPGNPKQAGHDDNLAPVAGEAAATLDAGRGRIPKTAPINRGLLVVSAFTLSLLMISLLSEDIRGAYKKAISRHVALNNVPGMGPSDQKSTTPGPVASSQGTQASQRATALPSPAEGPLAATAPLPSHLANFDTTYRVKYPALNGMSLHESSAYGRWGQQEGTGTFLTSRLWSYRSLAKQKPSGSSDTNVCRCTTGQPKRVVSKSEPPAREAPRIATPPQERAPDAAKRLDGDDECGGNALVPSPII